MNYADLTSRTLEYLKQQTWPVSRVMIRNYLGLPQSSIHGVMVNLITTLTQYENFAETDNNLYFLVDVVSLDHALKAEKWPAGVLNDPKLWEAYTQEPDPEKFLKKRQEIERKKQLEGMRKEQRSRRAKKNAERDSKVDRGIQRIVTQNICRRTGKYGEIMKEMKAREVFTTDWRRVVAKARIYLVESHRERTGELIKDVCVKYHFTNYKHYNSYKSGARKKYGIQ